MKVMHMKKCLAMMIIGFMVVSTLPVFPSDLFADPPEGKGNQGGNGNGNQGNQGNKGGNSDQAKAERGQNRADVVSRNADRAHSRQVGGKDFHARRPGDYGQRALPIQASDTAINSFSKRSDLARGRDASSLRDQNRKIVEDFEKAIGKLREHGKGKENARWWYNPKDERGQGNMGKVEMLDPYGHSKDDRMELYGNRGRKMPEIEEILLYLFTKYLYLDATVLLPHLYYEMGWGDFKISPWGTVDLTTLGYTPEEAAFLYSLSYSEIVAALYQGYIAMSTIETTLAPISELDLSRILNYIDTYKDPSKLYEFYSPGDTASYTISLTNPYDSPLMLSIEATITYLNERFVIYNRDWSTLTLETYTGAPLPGDSTQTWDSVTIQPGETINLYDTYYTPSGTLSVGSWVYQTYPDLYAYGSVVNGYSYDVTITDLSSGLTYSDPAAGWYGFTGVWNYPRTTYESQ